MSIIIRMNIHRNSTSVNIAGIIFFIIILVVIFIVVYLIIDKSNMIVKEKGLEQVSDDGAIEAIVDEIIAANADKAEEYKAGKDKLFGFFVGQVMKAMQGKGSPKAINDILKAKLK